MGLPPDRPPPDAPTAGPGPGREALGEPAPAERTPRGIVRQPIRVALVVIGTVALGLGVIGIVVPVLPTTPFVLLAAACYARASTRLYARLLGQPTLGPIVTEWRRSRALPPGVRRRALVLVVLTFGASILAVDAVQLRVVLAATALILLVFLYRIPTRA
jgi:hypothetical protein